MARFQAFDRWWNGISLRTKITGVTVLLLTLGLAVAGAGTMTVLRLYLLEQEDAKVQTLFRDVSALPTSTLSNCGVQYDPNGYLVAVIDAAGRVVCDNVPDGHPTPVLDDKDLAWVVEQNGNPTTIQDESGKNQWRVIATVVPLSAEGDYSTLIVGLDLSDIDSIIARYAVIFFGFAVAVVLLGAAITQLLVTSTFAPLRDVERTAARFAAGDYGQRLGGATPNTEVGRLNRSLNTMLARIDRAFADRARTIEQMRRFVGDASHELRTPLVSVRGYAELYRMGALQDPEAVASGDGSHRARGDPDGRAGRGPARARAPRRGPGASAGRRRSAAHRPRRRDGHLGREPGSGDHGAGARSGSLEERGVPGRCTVAAPVPPTTMTGPIAFAGATLARLRRRRPRPDAAPTDEPMPLPAVGPIVYAEENKIRQVVTNLLGNAMRFTPPDSPIELVVDVDRAGGYGAISVVDHGEGIPPQLREKIFERFWRADTSRTRDTGGSGLGLAIVAGIVANHNGHVEVLETPGRRSHLPGQPSPPPPRHRRRRVDRGRSQLSGRSRVLLTWPA